MQQQYDIKVSKPFTLEIEVIQKQEADIDNGIKSFIDRLVDIWNLKDDNHIQGVTIKRIGVCEDYSEGLIRFRIKQEVI